ncbi:hypothetical protein QQF21_11120 [Lelliottia sp. V89_10]|uniref:hypothetical protein n=1 Tax=Lelliottia wanjuensis TaxID=3050585 RepID=UPI00249E8F94|nr:MULTISPECIES: hypothetical protein [unclassified Lelliottia]MDI3360344.1 hypothetical protein [Lelliottia sp. V89_13]MDK9549430.1 hypothetical protein [Lelliottia sp. V89_5]MDK9596155.1 hypothetical protein [Lelliottia sp. V89_10]
MIKIQKKNINLIYTNGNLLILNSFHEFREWYISNVDLSIFLPEDVNALLDEEKPDNYPCTPLLNSSLYPVLYLNLNNLLIIQNLAEQHPSVLK